MASWLTEVDKKDYYDANTVVSSMSELRNRDAAPVEADSKGFDWFGKNDQDPNGDILGTQGGEQQTGLFGSGGTQGYNVVGINGNEISKMCSAIEDYVTAVQTELKTALDTTQTNLNTGFRGSDAEAAVKTYLDNTREYIQNFISRLNAFQSTLNSIGNAWVTAQSNIGGTVGKSSFNAGETYQQAVQYGGPSSGSSGSTSPAGSGS